MHILVEEFLKDNVAFKGDCYEVLANHREEFIDWRPDYELIRFVLAQLLPITSSSFKTIEATAHEIADHYDRGNDFFNAFLGPKMIYTSAFYHGLDQTLEQAQVNKLNMLCEKVHLKPGMTFLDIGCGWGTLVRHAASEFKAKATGVTLSAEGAAWCRAQAKAEGLSEAQCEILNCDYREIPKERTFDAISAVEMAGARVQRQDTSTLARFVAHPRAHPRAHRPFASHPCTPRLVPVSLRACFASCLLRHRRAVPALRARAPRLALRPRSAPAL